MNNLEKFNAETTPLGTELVTRDGRKVEEWYFFKSADSYPLVATIGGYSHKFTKDGTYNQDGNKSKYDLFIKPKVTEGYMNVYRQKDGLLYVGVTHETFKSAFNNRDKSNSYIKTIRITDEPE